jgi:acetolactate synthase-1/2/3 large subunit
MRVADYIFTYLAQLGIDKVFTLTGGGAMYLIDALGKNKEIESIFPLHEQSVAIMADAYAQYTGKLGVGLVTTGPGATNTITGIAASWIDSVPVLIITGQVKTADLNKGKKLRQKGIQEVDFVSMVKDITKYAATITDVSQVKDHLRNAVEACLTGRKGPAVLEIPLDIQNAEIDATSVSIDSIIKKEPTLIKNTDIEIFLDLLQKAKKPVFLIGNGVRDADLDHLRSIIFNFNTPVLLTWRAIDILDELNSLNFGRPGSIASRYANLILQESDLLILIGARIDFGQCAFNYKNFAPNAKKIIVDIDKEEIKKLDFEKELEIVCDATDFIECIYKRRFDVFIQNEDWIQQCFEYKRSYPLLPVENWAEKINTYNFIYQLSKHLNSDDIIIPCSSGSASEITQQSLPITLGQRVFCNPGLGSMGFGLPAAIGACLAGEKKRTICIVGDGSLQHNIQELELVKRYDLPIKIFVLNNKEYASIRATQNKFFEGNKVGCDKDSGVTLPDLSGIAEAYGIGYFRFEKESSLGVDLWYCLDEDMAPALIEVVINGNMLTQPRVMNYVDEEGKIVSGTLENMWPFLD